MIDDDPPETEDDDDSLPTEQPTASAVNQTTAKRQRAKQLTEQERARAWWSQALRDPIGGRIIWALLRDEMHVFSDEVFMSGPNGFPQPEATEYRRGQRDLGMRIYRTLVCYDREAVFALHDQLDPFFAKPKTARKPQRSE